MDSKSILNKRIAVAVFFFVNGFLYANWVARLPELQEFFNISNSVLGTLLFTTAAGALVAMPIAGWLTTKYRSERITMYVALLFCCCIPLIPISSNIWVARIFFFVFGCATGMMDVTMNGQAVLVERVWKKPIMSSFHAVFSIGMALGAGSGALFSKYHYSLSFHLQIITVIGIILITWASHSIIKNPFLKTRLVKKEGKNFASTMLAILPIGIIAFCGMTSEGAMVDWSAIFMHKVVGKTEAFSALAFGTFGVAMTTGRLFGDHFIYKWGKKKMLLYNTLIAISSLSLVIIFATTWTTLIGFFLIGLGLATIVPTIYSTAGNTAGIEPGAGIAMASTIGYTGFFIGPPLIGYLADVFGLRIGLCYTLFLLIIMFFLIWRFIRVEKK